MADQAAEQERVRLEEQLLRTLSTVNTMRFVLIGCVQGSTAQSLFPPKSISIFFYDVGPEVPAHERVSQWLGNDIGIAAHMGFEAFLRVDPPTLTARDIAASLRKVRATKMGIS